MVRTTDARQKALQTAERLFRAQGYAATGLIQILEESGAPKGSFYFHFPGGKQQLAREVLALYGARVEHGLRELAARHANDPSQFMRALCHLSAKEMAAANWDLGCAAQNLANELAPSDSAMADQLAAIFESWSAVIAEAIEPGCASPGEAKQRAVAFLAALEGARTLARAARSAAPFDAVASLFAPMTAATGERG